MNCVEMCGRDYEASVRLSIVENCYRLNHINQTYDFVSTLSIGKCILNYCVRLGTTYLAETENFLLKVP